MNITISSSKNDFLVFQLVTFPLLDDEKMLEYGIKIPACLPLS